MPLEAKQSSPLISDAALRLPGAPPGLPADVLERFPSLRTWSDEQTRFWRGAQNGIEEFARASMDVLEVGGVLAVDPNNASLFIRGTRGDGAYKDPETPFFVNRAGYFSLKNKLYWDPTTNILTVSGTIIANAGFIGGFVIDTDNLRDAADSFGLSSVVTGGDDIRFWSGSTFAARATAPFRVYESGAIAASSGVIGGFNIGTDYLRDVANTFGFASTVTGGTDVRMWAGDTFANRATAPVRIYEDGSATFAGNITFATTNRILATDNTSFQTWQGDAGINIPGYYAQHEAGAAGGIAILAVGTNAVAGSFYTKARGTFGALSAVSTDDIIFASAHQFYTGATWTSAATFRTGITNSTSTPYHFINVGAYTWIFNYDGKLYFGDASTGGPANAFGAPYTPDFTSNIYWSAAGTIKTDGNLVVTGACTAASFSGSGASLTALNASNISSGTIANARLPSAISVSSLTASGEIRGATARFGTFTGTADAPVNGWIDVTDAGGNGRKLATIA